MEFNIIPSQQKTAVQYFANNKDFIVLNPLETHITGLVLCLEGFHGDSVKIPIPDTNSPVKERISEYASIWFEFLTADKEYTLMLGIR
jgi:hypothetical protein